MTDDSQSKPQAAVRPVETGKNARCILCHPLVTFQKEAFAYIEVGEIVKAGEFNLARTLFMGERKGPVQKGWRYWLSPDHFEGMD